MENSTPAARPARVNRTGWKAYEDRKSWTRTTTEGLWEHVWKTDRGLWVSSIRASTPYAGDNAPSDTLEVQSEGPSPLYVLRKSRRIAAALAKAAPAMLRPTLRRKAAK